MVRAVVPGPASASAFRCGCCDGSKGVGDVGGWWVCEFLQCTVLGKHGAVSDDVTLRGRDVIFFLKQAQILSR